MELTALQKRHLLTEGWVHASDVIPREKIDAALRAVNAWMGEGMPPDQMEIYSSQSFCPDDRSNPVFLDLFERTPALQLVDAAFGEGMIVRGHRAQIALRFPLPHGTPRSAPGPHLDGIAT